MKNIGEKVTIGIGVSIISYFLIKKWGYLLEDLVGIEIPDLTNGNGNGNGNNTRTCQNITNLTDWNYPLIHPVAHCPRTVFTEGEAVKVLQREINDAIMNNIVPPMRANAAYLDVDGKYGPLTQSEHTKLMSKFGVKERTVMAIYGKVGAFNVNSFST